MEHNSTENTVDERNSRVGSASLLIFTVENQFPASIARPFYELRSFHDWQAEIAQLANVLGVSLEHLGIIALAEYFSGSERDLTLNARLLETLKRQISHGKWSEVAREILGFLRRRPSSFFISELEQHYFPPKEKPKAVSLKNIGDDLINLRNELLKRSAESPPTNDHHQKFKKALFDLLQTLLFLKDYPLVAVRNSHISSGIKNHEAFSLVGFHDNFELISFQCDLDLESSRVVMLNPVAREILYLHPFYQFRQCPEPSCRFQHLFRFEKLEKNYIEYIAIGGHRLKDATAATDLLALFDSAQSINPPLRQKAQRLHLETATEWLPRAAGSRVNNQFEIIKLLRRGGMSDVYEIKDLTVNSPKAMKLLPFQFLRDQKMVQRFRQEVLQSRLLEHPNVTAVFEYGADLGEQFFTMELADGWIKTDGNLALDAGELSKPVEERQVINIIKQACAGLDYIHQKQIVHRDIKPGNLLLFKDECVKLADFGIARFRESVTLTVTGLAMGTPEYMSPEQAEGRRDLTAASDIYSLGTVMYELLTGEPPFKRSTPLAVALAHLREVPVSPRQLNPHISEEIERITLKCLEKSAENRFTTARQLFLELERFERTIKHDHLSLKILTPRADTLLKPGETCQIKWEVESSESQFQEKVEIELLKNGNPISTIAKLQFEELSPPNKTTVYDWKTPAELLPNEKYAIRARAFDNKGQIAEAVTPLMITAMENKTTASAGGSEFFKWVISVLGFIAGYFLVAPFVKPVFLEIFGKSFDPATLKQLETSSAIPFICAVICAIIAHYFAD